MTLWIITLLCSALCYSLGVQIEKGRLEKVIKSLSVENLALNASAEEYISNTRIELMQKVMDYLISSCSNFLAKNGHCSYEDAWKEIYAIREESAYEKIESAMNKSNGNDPSIEDRLEIVTGVSKDCTDACATLISRKAGVAIDGAYEMVYSYTKEAIFYYAEDLMRGKWESPRDQFNALLYGHG